MKHDIFFNTKDLLIEWLDENFPDAILKHIEPNGATYYAGDCKIIVTGHHILLNFNVTEED